MSRKKSGPDMLVLCQFHQAVNAGTELTFTETRDNKSILVSVCDGLG